MAVTAASVTAINHELQLGQQPLHALSAEQRATFHWLLLALPQDLTARAALEAELVPTPRPYGDALAQWQAEARPAHCLTIQPHHYPDADAQGQAVAALDLCQSRLLQALRPQPLVARTELDAPLPVAVRDNLPLWRQQQLEGRVVASIGALEAAVELAAIHHQAA